MYSLGKLVFSYKFVVLFFAILLLHIFLRFYQLEERGQFAWDQVDFAWTAKDMIVDGKFPLKGVVAKQNTGFHIGPAYHYLIAPFYDIYNLDPRASLVFAGVTSIFSLLVCFYCTLKLFNRNTALIAAFIYAISFFIIEFDRIQWTVNFIAPISFIIFYSLYKVLTGNIKYVYLLASAVGFSFHLHFTAIFFPIIIFLSLPFLKFSLETIKHYFLSIFVLFVWFIPTVISEISEKATSTGSIIKYVSATNHGFHLTRFFQLANDAFIEFGTIFTFKINEADKFIFLPLFYFMYLRKNITREKIIFLYLVFLWFFVPWVVFSLYSGEITLYYFSLTRPIVIMIFAYLLAIVLFNKSFLLRILGIGVILLYSYINLSSFFKAEYQGLDYHREKVNQALSRGEVIEFAGGVPEPYIYYIYTRNK